jgi:hypothetical protein
MGQEPLVSEQIDAGARFLGEFQKYALVQTAFWLKESEEGPWYLYVASPQITDENVDEGYGEVVRITSSMRDPWFDPTHVKLIGAEERMAKAAVELQQRYPGRAPLRFHDQALDGLSIAEGYIYPLHPTAA